MNNYFVPANFFLNRFFCALLLGTLLTSLASRAHAELQVHSLGGSTVTGHFDQFLDDASATKADHYTIYSKGGSGITATNAVLQSDGQTVALYLDAPVGEFFAVGVSNVLDFSLSNIVASATGIISDFTSTSIGTAQDPLPVGEAIPFYRDTFNVTASGSDIGGTDDHCQFVYQKITGDFEMITLVTRLDKTDSLSKAGLMVREDVSPGSRSLGIYFTPVNTSPKTNQLLSLVRPTANGNATNVAAPLATTALNWLRVTRTNNVFTVYYGANGSTWTQVGQSSQSWNNTLYIGLAVTAHKNSFTTTAGFTSFGVAGAKPGAAAVPFLNAWIYQRTNLVVSWQRTVSDFCPQVATNIIGNTNGSSQNFSNATQWAYVLYPVFDTSLTGTNGAMPTAGRYMIIPVNLFSNRQMFVRLARVERLIPDPLGVTPGIILSQSSGSMNATTPSGSTICSTTVDTTTALVQSSVPVLCPVGKTYQFTTAPSGTTLQTVIQVRNYPGVLTTTCDGIYSAGSFKSQVTLTPGGANTGYTFLAAATTAIKPSVCNAIQVQVNIR